MKEVNLEALTQKINAFAVERDWDQFHSIKNLSMALSVEASELLEIFQWMTEKDSNLIVPETKNYQKVKEEVADIFIYLLRIAGKMNLDLEKIALEKLKANGEKYPVELARGNSKKYNEL